MNADCPTCASLCPVCADPPDYCSGHGPMGDPVGAAILAKHDDGDHSDCRACDGYCFDCGTGNPDLAEPESGVVESGGQLVRVFIAASQDVAGLVHITVGETRLIASWREAVSVSTAIARQAAIAANREVGTQVDIYRMPAPPEPNDGPTG